MRVLVTGGCGFLGSHVCELFKKEGFEVVSLDNLTNYEFSKSGYSIKARLYNFYYLKEKLNIDTLVLDLRRWNSIKDLEADFIVHTAAQPTMTLSIEDPRYDLENNVLATFNILELSRRLDVPVVLCSTIHVYGNRINQRLKEKETRFESEPPTINEEAEVLNGEVTPLHASKRSAEIYGQCYIDTYNLKVGIFRLTGMYGPRQFAGMHHGWVSNFIIRTLLNLPIYIYGTDKQVRDILYASDAAESFLKFFSRPVPGVYNIGGGLENAVSIRECLDMIEELTGIKQERIMLPKRFGDLYYFVCDYKKARETFNWSPKTRPREGLEKTVEWFKNNIDILKEASMK